MDGKKIMKITNGNEILGLCAAELICGVQG